MASPNYLFIKITSNALSIGDFNGKISDNSHGCLNNLINLLQGISCGAVSATVEVSSATSDQIITKDGANGKTVTHSKK